MAALTVTKDFIEGLVTENAEAMLQSINSEVEILVQRMEKDINAGLARGADPEAMLQGITDGFLGDAQAGGFSGHWGDFTKNMTKDVDRNFQDFHDDVYLTEAEVKESELMMWITGSEGKKICPSCLPRHGQVATMENWEIRGLPRAGWWSFCGFQCQCQLMPASSIDRAEVREPLNMFSRKERRDIRRLGQTGGPVTGSAGKRDRALLSRLTDSILSKISE